MESKIIPVVKKATDKEFRKLSKIPQSRTTVNNSTTRTLYYTLEQEGQKTLIYHKKVKNFLKSATLQEKHILHLSFQESTVAKFKMCSFWKKKNTFCFQESLYVKTSLHLLVTTKVDLYFRNQSITPRFLQMFHIPS